jgi:hypothetical protein
MLRTYETDLLEDLCKILRREFYSRGAECTLPSEDEKVLIEAEQRIKDLDEAQF